MHEQEPVERPRERPVLTWVGRIALAAAAVCAVVALAAVLHHMLTPGGTDLRLLMGGFLVGLVALGLLVVLVVVGVLERRWRRPLSALAILLVMWLGVTAASSSSPLHDWHWQWMRGDLDTAQAAGVCPERAGFAAVVRCDEGPGGTRLYYFGGGGYTNYLAELTPEQRAALEATQHAPADQRDGYWEVPLALGDGWHVVVHVGGSGARATR